MPDWEMTYPGTRLVFGSVAPGLVLTDAPEVGPVVIEADDVGRPRGDGVAFGADFFGGRTVTFDVAVIGGDEVTGRALLEGLQRAWRGDAVRVRPGAVASLTSPSGRTVFGRPRRFVSDDSLSLSGVATVIADFVTADSVWYSGVEHVATVLLVPDPGGGLIAPLAAPLTTTATSDRSQVFTVGGSMPTQPVFEIQGPITNPVVEIVGLCSLEFRLSLAYDEVLVVDTRPWARSVMVGSGSYAGALTRGSTRLSDVVVPPGVYELALRGVSAPGSASATVRWREAFASY